jgi:TatD DNase family protein
MGFYIGVGGVVTFKNGKKLKQTVDKIPLDRILLETDCPYMAPEPFRGSRNSSVYLPYVVKAIADIKGVTPQEVIDITEQNARRFYGIRS